jgi:UDP-N-acetylglucosamine transferase subunit ALG13
MPAENLPRQTRKPRILLSPLDWGLGHATRCIPIIRELISHDCDVWLACDGTNKRLLADEFPELTILEMPGYKIRYSKSGKGLFFRMLVQVPKLLDMISYENHWLETKNPVYEFDAVISDNRFGFRNKKIHSVFITHQLFIKSGIGGMADAFLRFLQYGYINKFDQCWVPDIENKNSFAGELSHPSRLPKTPVEYIGMLSRFKTATATEIKKHILVILSGPEPQRTILEKIVLKDIINYPFTATVVRGLPGEIKYIPATENIKFHNHLNAEDMNREMEKAEFIISRSGYSTIMDLARLQKKSILIPTPGQTEQLYLAKNLTANNHAVCVTQNNFSLTDAITKAESFSYQPFPQYDDGLLKQAVKSLLKKLETKINQSIYAEFLG